MTLLCLIAETILAAAVTMFIFCVALWVISLAIGAFQ